MATAIVLRENGGPGVLRSETVRVGRPDAGELRIRQTAIGVNFHDVYVRSGLYRTLPLPGIPGIEAAGVVEEIGSEVSDFAVGDRVAYVTGRYGAYASERTVPAVLAVRLPPEISEQTAATVLLKGLTAEMLVRDVYRVRSGDVVLIHAAAGGVGRLLCQFAQHLGATVIGTVGSEAKADVARRAGCAHTILYRQARGQLDPKFPCSGCGEPAQLRPIPATRCERKVRSGPEIGVMVLPSLSDTTGALRPFWRVSVEAACPLSFGLTVADPAPCTPRAVASFLVGPAGFAVTLSDTTRYFCSRKPQFPSGPRDLTHRARVSDKNRSASRNPVDCSVKRWAAM